MGIVVTSTAGLCIWIILWALDVSGFDGILIAVTLVLIAIGLQNVIPNLKARKDR